MIDHSNNGVVDVLIVTALKEEYDAVLMVEAGAAPNSAWVEGLPETKNRAARRYFIAADGGPLRIFVTQALDMGRSETANAAVPFLEKYAVRCLAMFGLCAERYRVFELRDVIVPDTL